MAAADYYTQVYTMFVGYYGRPPAQSGLDYYAGLVDKAGGSMAVVIDDFFKSAESQAFFAGKSVEQRVNQIFQNLFGRDALPAGLNYWAGLITNGTVALSQAAYTIANNAAAADVDVRDAKVASAKAWVAGLDTTAEILAFGTDAGREAGRDFLKVVTTSTPATQAAVDAALKAMVDGGTTNPGQTFTLTKGVDDLKGTTGNDTIIAAIDANAESNTLNTGDVIDGLGGTDKLDLTIGTPLNPTVTIKNVEVLEVRNAAAGGNVDMRNTDGAVKSIIEKQSTQGFTANFIAAADVAVSIKDVTTTALVSDYNWNAGALAGAADAASLTLNNVVGTATGRHNVLLQGGTATQGFETVNVKTEGAASNLANLIVTGSTGVTDTMTKLVVTGDQNLTIANTAFAATGGQIDASAFTGNLTVNTVNAVDVDFKGGKGNDTILFGATLQATDKIDGGDGTDTLGANAFADLQAAFTAGRVSNIEAIRIEQAILTNNGTLDVARAGNVNSVSVNGIGANTNAINNLQDNATLTVTANTAGGTLNANIKDATLAGTANTLTVNLGTAADAAAIAAGTIGAAGVETLNVGSLGTSAGTNTVTITGNADLAKMVVTGAEGVTVTFTGGGAALKEFDASKATGIQNTSNIAFSGSGASIAGGNKADVLLGGAGNDTIVGGAGNDVLTGGMGSDVLTGGEGSDTFRLGTNGNAANATNTIVDSITDFVLGSGNDVIDLSLLPNNLRPLQNGDVSSTVVKALNGALPTGGANGTAELIILDSSVADMRAADSQALNAKLFNLAGAGNQGQVLVAYSATDGGNVRLAVANIAGGDITNVIDLAVLNGVTTDSLASGFNAANLMGFQVNAVFDVAAARAATNAGMPAGATIVDTAANLQTLTAVEIAAFTNVTEFRAETAGNPAVALSLSWAQFNAAGNARLNATNIVTVRDTGAVIAANAAALAAAGNVDAVDANDNAITLTSVATATALNAKLTAADVVTVLDMGAAIAGLTAAQLGALTNVDNIWAADGAITLNVAQELAADAKLRAADAITVLDTGANIAAMTVPQLGSVNIDFVDASDDVLNVTVAQISNITNAKLTAGDVVTVLDAGATIAINIGGGSNLEGFTNLDFVDANDNALTLEQAQLTAITNGKLVANDVVTIADAAGTLQGVGGVLNSAADVAAATNVDVIDVTGGAITLDGAVFNAVLAAGKTFAANDVIRLDAAGALAINAIPATGFGGDTVIVLGGAANGAVTINLANSGKIDIGLAGTGDHDVTASAATVETFTLADVYNGGVILRGLTSGDKLNVDGANGITALKLNQATAAAVAGAGDWNFTSGVLTYWDDADGAAKSIGLVGVANVIVGGDGDTFTVV